MTREELRRALAREVEVWSRKDCATLRAELADVVAYERADPPAEYQVEVLLVEDRPDFVQVVVSVSGGGLSDWVSPTRSFVVHADGRVDV